jgi:antitoxin component of MazEF toxin-antitoxin module
VGRWGSSLGVVIPNEVVRRLHLQPGDDIYLEVQRSGGMFEAFGSLRDWKVDTQKLMDKLRGGW